MIRSIRLGHAPNCSSLGNVLNTLVWTQIAVTTVWVAAEAWAVRRRRREAGGESRLIDTPAAVVRTGDDGPQAAPLEAHVQLTRACGLPCPSCHIDPSADGAHVATDVLDERLRALAERGVFRVAFGGGEALRHPDLAEVGRRAKAHGLTTGLTTSGVGLDEARAADLGDFDQVNVSFDGLGETYRASRGYDGAEIALRAVRTLAATGRRVGVNIVLDRDTFPVLADTVRAAVAAGARDIQLLRLKPAGRAVSAYLDRRLTPVQGLAFWPVTQALIDEHPGVTFRADCALVPFLAAHAPDLDRLTRFAFTGCHGGDALVSVDTGGAEHPCSFHAGPVTPEWGVGVVSGPCATCAYRSVCRGGCHVVAAVVNGELFSPDPECPIVRLEAGGWRPEVVRLEAGGWRPEEEKI